METLFSTSTLHPRDRFDYWHSVACKAVFNNDSTPGRRETFRAELKSGALAEIGLVLFEHSPTSFWYRERHIARASADDVFVCRQIAGEVYMEQDCRKVALQPGDIALFDPRSPYAGRSYGDSSTLILKIPRQMLEPRVGNLREMAFRNVKPTSADSRLASALLAMVPAHAEGLSQAGEDILKNQTLDLIALALAQASEGGRPSPSCARSLVLMKVRAAIEARLADPHLDVAKVAAAAGVSVRHANAVLAEHGFSISRLIQARRLARCRSALDDPMQIHRTVSEIAYDWGFSDMTHFGRRFRAAFGSLPSDYRKARRTAG